MGNGYFYDCLSSLYKKFCDFVYINQILLLLFLCLHLYIVQRNSVTLWHKINPTQMRLPSFLFYSYKTWLFIYIFIAAFELLQKRSRIFSSNALLQFLLEGSPIVKEQWLDSRKDVDRQLKSSCEVFIADATNSILGPLVKFLEKVIYHFFNLISCNYYFFYFVSLRLKKLCHSFHSKYAIVGSSGVGTTPTIPAVWRQVMGHQLVKLIE